MDRLFAPEERRLHHKRRNPLDTSREEETEVGQYHDSTQHTRKRKEKNLSLYKLELVIQNVSAWRADIQGIAGNRDSLLARAPDS